MRSFVALITDFRLVLYNLLALLLSPLLLLSKLARYFKQKQRTGSYRLREFDWMRFSPLCFPESKDSRQPRADDDAVRVVFLGSAWSFVRMMDQMTKALHEKDPLIKTTWCLRERHALRSALELYECQSVSVVPFDFFLPVLIWLRRLSPDVVVLIGEMIHPNIVKCAANCGARVAVVNGKLNSYDRVQHRVWMPLHRWVLRSFSRVCIKTEEHKRRLKSLLGADYDYARKVRVVGDIKFGLCAANKTEDLEGLAAWLATRGERILLAAGSTSAADEDWILQAFQSVRQQVPCSLLLAPRRVWRRDEVVQQITSLGLTASLRTQSADQHGAADVYVLDTLGELASSYQWSAAAFIGGTLEGIGHDVIEPVVWGLPVSYGPGKGKVPLGQQVCDKAGIGFRVHSPVELATHWLTILRDAELRQDISRRAAAVIEEHSQSLAQNIDAILELVQEVKLERRRSQ